MRFIWEEGVVVGKGVEKEEFRCVCVFGEEADIV